MEENKKIVLAPSDIKRLIVEQSDAELVIARLARRVRDLEDSGAYTEQQDDEMVDVLDFIEERSTVLKHPLLLECDDLDDDDNDDYKT